MTTEQQTQTNPQGQTGEPAENTPEWYRANIERVNTENKALKQQLREGTFREAGIDTSKGLGKTMAEMYDGENSADALTAWAADKFDWKPAAPSQDGASGQTPEQVAAQQVVTEGQGRVEQATAAAQSTETPPAGSIAELKTKIAAAEEAGNFPESIRLKRQWTEQIARQQQPLPK